MLSAFSTKPDLSRPALYHSHVVVSLRQPN